jgi:hypothetical protein
MLKSQTVEDGAWIFVRMSDINEDVFADWYGEHPFRGTNSWSRQAIVFDVPREAANLTFGFVLRGRGVVWADNFLLEVVDASEPLAAGAMVFRRGPVGLTFEPPR